jgi:hypothetical protein
MNADDFKSGDMVAFDFPNDGELAGTEFIAKVVYVEDGNVCVDAEFQSDDDMEMYVVLDPKILRKLSEAELFKKRLEGKNIGMKGYIKWANGS